MLGTKSKKFRPESPLEVQNIPQGALGVNKQCGCREQKQFEYTIRRNVPANPVY